MIVEEKYFAGYQYMDADLKLKNSGILRILEDMAGLHGIYAGESILTAPTTWILTAYRVVVKRRPIYGDRLNVRTWSREAKNYFACREFEILDKNGEQMVCAISEWAHINRADGNLEKVSPELAAAYSPEPDYTNFGALRIKRLREPQEYSDEHSFVVGRNWIDANHHMNNVYYMDLAEMALENQNPEFRADTFEIFYRKEIKCGETVQCRVSPLENGYFIRIADESGESTNAQLMLYYN